jgi:hypothetical protein
MIQTREQLRKEATTILAGRIAEREAALVAKQRAQAALDEATNRFQWAIDNVKREEINVRELYQQES